MRLPTDARAPVVTVDEAIALLINLRSMPQCPPATKRVAASAFDVSLRGGGAEVFDCPSGRDGEGTRLGPFTRPR
jgi:hypothetical protein